MSRKIILSIAAVLCFATPCLADGFGRIGSAGDDDWGWLLLGILFIVLPLVPLLLAFLSFRSKNRILNIMAWAVVLLCISLFLVSESRYTDHVMRGVYWIEIMPNLLLLSLGLLVSKSARTYSGNRFIALKLVVSALYLYAFAGLFTQTIILIHVFFNMAMQLAIAAIVFAFQGWLVYRVISQAAKRGIVVQGIMRPATWGIAVGAIEYLVVFCFGFFRLSELLHDLFLRPPPNIYTNILCWGLSGLIAGMVSKRIEKEQAG